MNKANSCMKNSTFKIDPLVELTNGIDALYNLNQCHLCGYYLWHIDDTVPFLVNESYYTVHKSCADVEIVSVPNKRKRTN